MILVTGGTGLLGNHLLRHLSAEGKPVRALYRNSIPFNAPGLEWQKGDILDVSTLEVAMQGVEQVYHCAGLVSFNPKKKLELFKINAEGTANMVNAALSAGVKKFLHVSSVAALGRKRNNQTITENTQWEESANNSNYGYSKWLAELEVWRGIGEGLEAVIVNPTIVLGMSNWDSGSSAMFKNAYQQFPWYTEGVTGFVDAEDVVKAMISLMENNIQAERFILNAENWSFRQVLSAMANAFEKRPPHRKVNPLIAGLVWRLEKVKHAFTGLEPLLTRETSNTAQLKVYFDNSKLKQFLPGFSYRPLQETIEFYCRQYSEKLNGR